MQTAEVISAETLDKLRTLDEQVRADARRIAVEHQTGSGLWYEGWCKAALRGGYDEDSDFVALRAAIRRGIEIARTA